MNSLLADKELQDDKIEEMIQKIITFKGKDGKLLLESFNIEYVNNFLGRNLTSIESIFGQYKNKKGIDIIDFLYQMLTQMDYNYNETLFVAVALIDFFQGIVENENLSQLIKFQNITNFICENDPTFAEGVVSDRKIPTKKLPEEKRFDINRTRRIVREIDINPPILFKDDDALIRRLTKENNCIDAVHHNKNMIIGSHFAASLQRIITLDSYADHFLFYNGECAVTQEIYPKLQQLKSQVCIDFYWSNKQQRLGASFRDGYLVFWEASDNFEYEKVFQIGQSLTEEQSKIWYVECIDKWVTTDKKNQLYIWDLEKEMVSHTLKSDTFAKGILQIQEIPYLTVIAVATCDNQIAIWDFIHLKQLFRIEVDHSHLNQIIFFKTYQLILTAGYDNVINVYSLHSSYNDYNSLGKLHGHQTLVTAIQCIENTPMVITADDRFNIKVWDIRNMKCIQNMNIDLRNSIRFIHILQDRICLVSSRVTCLLFEDELQNPKAIKDSFYPIAIEYDPNKKEMSVCSRKDVKYFDIETGRVKKIISGIITSSEDEITTFRVFQQNKKFLVGNQKGMIKIYSSKEGEILGKIQGHTDEVSVIRIDYLNKLLTSASFDGNIYIKKELQNGTFEKLREISTGKEIQNIDISVYHNLMIATFSSNEIYLINYEFGKLMAIFYLNQNEEPNCLEFISGYSIFIIGTTLGKIYFVQFKIQDDTISLSLVSQISLNEEDDDNDVNINSVTDRYNYQHTDEIADLLIGTEKLKDEDKNNQVKFNQRNKYSFIQKGDVQTIIKQQLAQTINSNKNNNNSNNNDNINQNNYQNIYNNNVVNQLINPQTQKKKKDLVIAQKIMFDLSNKHLIVAQHNGEIKMFNINSLFLKQSIQKIAHCNKKANYNAFRSSKEDFSKVIDKISQFRLYSDRIIKDVQINSQQQYPATNILAHTIFLGSVAIENIPMTHNSAQNQQNSIIISPRTQINRPSKSNPRNIPAKNGRDSSQYTLKDDQGRQDPYFNQTKNLAKTVLAHKDQIQCLQFIDLGKKYILTSSLDSYIKIWTYPELELCGNLNTEHPLPILWKIEIDQSRQYKIKLLYALQSMQCVVSKYGSQINHLQEKKFNFFSLFQEVMKSDLSKYKVQQNIVNSEQRSRTENSPTSVFQKKERKSFQQYVNDQLKIKRESFSHQPDDKSLEDSNLINDNKNLHKSKVKLMKEEYTVRDLIYDKIKDFYQEELKGPSLKHLNEMKKLYEAQTQQKKQNSLFFDASFKYKFERMEEKSKEFKHIYTFLDENYRQKILEKPNSEFIDKLKYVEDLDERLERSLQKKKRTAVVVLKDDNSSKDSTQNKYYKRDNQRKMQTLQKKLRMSPTKREQKESYTNGDTFTQGKNSKSDFRITNSTSCNSFQQKNNSFYSYANKKNLLDDQTTLDYSEVNKNYKNTHSSLEHGLLRKTETKCFSNIMKKMDEKLKKSKVQFQQLSRSNFQNFTALSDQHSNEIRTSFTNNFFNLSKKSFNGNLKLDSLIKKTSNTSINNSDIDYNTNNAQITNGFDTLYKRASSRVLKRF